MTTRKQMLLPKQDEFQNGTNNPEGSMWANGD